MMSPVKTISIVGATVVGGRVDTGAGGTVGVVAGVAPGGRDSSSSSRPSLVAVSSEADVDASSVWRTRVNNPPTIAATARHRITSARTPST